MSISSISNISSLFSTASTPSTTASQPATGTGTDGTLLSTIAATPSIASSTGSNWLDEAQTAIQASESSGGILGALQSSSQDNKPGSIASFLAQSQATADNLATIMQSAVQNAGQLYAQIAQTEGQQAAQQRQAQESALLNPPPQTNYTPPASLNPVEYYADGSSLDSTSNILTLSNGNQIDVTTGLPYVDPSSLVSLANGAYLNTASNVVTELDGTQIDATTGLKVSTTA
jgi:hypothetical protein